MQIHSEERANRISILEFAKQEIVNVLLNVRNLKKAKGIGQQVRCNPNLASSWTGFYPSIAFGPINPTRLITEHRTRI